MKVTSADERGGGMFPGGQNLRMLREQLGLTMRDVEMASTRIGQRCSNDEFIIAPSRLSDIETKGIIPSIYRLYSLAVIYRRDIRELFSWYGVDLNHSAEDMDYAIPPKSHVSDALANLSSVQMPVRLDPGFDPRRTVNLKRMVEQWGPVPLAYLEQFASGPYTYGYIGSDDLTMYPILPPGSFVQIDESKNRAAEGGWRSEYERPIYFVETRNGHTCCWCTMTCEEEIILQPHPLSPVAPRALRYPQEAEIIGQVVGIAIRLGDWRPVLEPSANLDSSADSKVHEVLN